MKLVKKSVTDPLKVSVKDFNLSLQNISAERDSIRNSVKTESVSPSSFSSSQASTMKKLKDYWPLFERVSKLVIKNFDIQSEAAFKKAYQSDQPVMTILNHSTPLSWLPPICVLIDRICREGGGQRVPVGVMDRYFFKNPLLKPLAGYITQFNHVLSFDEVLNKLISRECTDIAIFPEGSNCFFGPGEKIQPFRSPRFIELALRSETPILLTVHRGSEEWARTFQVQPKNVPLMAYMPGWLNEKIQRGGHFVMPLLPKPIQNFRLVCEFYEPKIKLADLRTSRRKKVGLLWQEAERVQAKMQQMFDSLAV